jgi:hypothetical protein
MKIGETLGFKVTGKDTLGNPFALTTENVQVTLSDGALGTVEPHPDGVAYHYLFTATANGDELITASDPDLPTVTPGTLDEVIEAALGSLEITPD